MESGLKSPNDSGPAPAASAAAHTESRLTCRRDGLAILTLDGPSRLNALSTEAVRRFCATLDVVAERPDIRVVILTGAGRGFCAGWDLTSALPTPTGREPTVADLMAGQELFSGMVKRLRSLDAVVIAAVNGAAVGAGCALALAADIRLASRSAAFHIGSVRIGLTAGECGISYHLPRLIGASRAFELMLTGRPVSANEAERIGLVTRVVDESDLLSQAEELAAQVLRNSPYSTRHTKALMWRNLEAPDLESAIALENRAQVLALLTDDFREAREAFTQKRPPVFSRK